MSGISGIQPESAPEQRRWISQYLVYEAMEKHARVAIADRDTNLEIYLSAVMLGTLICVKEGASAPKESLDALGQQLNARQNKRAVAVLCGSDDDNARLKIKKLMKGMVAGLRVVPVDTFDVVELELGKMRKTFWNWSYNFDFGADWQDMQEVSFVCLCKRSFVSSFIPLLLHPCSLARWPGCVHEGRKSVGHGAGHAALRRTTFL